MVAGRGIGAGRINNKLRKKFLGTDLHNLCPFFFYSNGMIAKLTIIPYDAVRSEIDTGA
jgi:hypothetical protein